MVYSLEEHKYEKHWRMKVRQHLIRGRSQWEDAYLRGLVSFTLDNGEGIELKTIHMKILSLMAVNMRRYMVPVIDKVPVAMGEE